MKNKLYILLALFTLLPMGASAGKIDHGRIVSVKIEGDFNGWGSAGDTWYYDVASENNNKWSNTFYVKTSDLTSADAAGCKQAYFKLRIGDEYSNTYEFGYNNDGDANFVAVTTETNWNNIGNQSQGNYNYVQDAAGGGAMRIHFVNASSGYVMLQTNFWGSTEEGGANWNTRLTFTQTPIDLTVADVTAYATANSRVVPTYTGIASNTTYSYSVAKTNATDPDLTIAVDGTFKAPNVTSKTTYTVTVTASDNYAKGDGPITITTTATITVLPVETITIYFNTSAADGWSTSDIRAHWWFDGAEGDVKATKIEKPHVTTLWFVAEIPIHPTQKITNFQANNAGGSYTQDGSEDITNVSTSSAYIIKKKESDYAKHKWEVSNELEVKRSFIYTKEGDTGKYWETVTTANEMFSYYVSNTASEYGLFQGNDIDGYVKKTAWSVPETSGIYYAEMTNYSIATPAAYTGNYYIRTNAAAGGWDNYKTEEDNLMTYYPPQEGFTDLDRYYWVKWVENKDVNAAIANDYNNDLAGLLGEYNLNSSTGGANVRFGYDPATNNFTRSLMGGSSTDDFLTIHATKDDKIFTKDGDNYTSRVEANPVKFNDAEDFIYTADLYVVPGAEGVVKVHHHETTRDMFEGGSKTLLSEGFEGDNPSAYKHHFKIFYDYKHNRILSGWMPTTEITGNKEVHRRLCISRDANDAPEAPLQLAEGCTLVVDNAVVEMVITEEDVDAHGGYFWFSLPFDCTIKDMVVGIDATYGPVDSKKGDWCIQYYRGDLRTAAGESESVYWRYLMNTTTLQANRGYVLQIDTEADLKYPLTVFFQSNAGAVTLEGSPTITAETHTTTDNSKNAHTNWNLIGSGALHHTLTDTWTDSNRDYAAIQKYYYGWKWNTETKKGEYFLLSAADDSMNPTHSYFVQFGGTINMTPHVSDPSGASAALRAPEKNDIYFMRMEVNNGEKADKTYIVLDSDATTAYDLNLDLGKIINDGMPQVYTLCGASQLAANNLPLVESQTIHIGVIANKAGTYTFSLPKVSAGVTPVLYDSETGSVIDLALDDYTVALEAGTYNQRFTLKVGVQNATTAITNTEAEHTIVQTSEGLLISGLTELTSVRLYDTTGRLLYSSTIQYEYLPTFPTGVYMLQIGNTTQRVLIK